jgi:hypothetical protein
MLIAVLALLLDSMPARHAAGDLPRRRLPADAQRLARGRGARRQAELNDGVVPYELNTPLFTDYAHKLRTIWMPKGTRRSTTRQRLLTFPSARSSARRSITRAKGRSGKFTDVARTYDTRVTSPARDSTWPKRAFGRDAHPCAAQRRLGGDALRVERRADRGHARPHRRDVQPLTLVDATMATCVRGLQLRGAGSKPVRQLPRAGLDRHARSIRSA